MEVAGPGKIKKIITPAGSKMNNGINAINR